MPPKHKRPRTDEYSNRNLPSDIIFNILLFLRVKTLSRFKLVSKSWASLISSPSFKASHHCRSKQNPLLFVTTREGHEKHHLYHIVDKRGGKSLEREIADISLGEPFHRLVFSCLDLVCLYSSKHIYIRNPATKEQITLPNKSSQFNSEIYDHQHVAFAYLPSVGEYKVFRRFGTCKYDFCEVFTLGSERWRDVGALPFGFFYSNMVVVDEAIHILPLTFQAQVIDGPEYDNSTGIARFDLKKEEWSVLPMPGSRYFSQYSPDNGWCFYLKPIGGLLCMECLGRTKVDVWLLTDYNNSVWVKAYSIDFCRTSEFEFDHDPWFHVVEVEEDGKVLLEKPDGKLQFYDPKEKRVEKTIFRGSSSFSFYVESFMTLDDASFKSLKK